MWQKIKNLQEGLVVLITEKTSLSDKNGYGSNYDHFLFNSKTQQTQSCHPDKAQVVDFVSEDLILDNGFDLGSELAKFKNPKRYDEVIRYYKDRIENRAWVTRTAEYYEYSDLDQQSLETLPSDLLRSTKVCDGSDTRFKKQDLKVSDSLIADIECNLLYASDPFRHLSFAMSDHLPISLTCSF